MADAGEIKNMNTQAVRRVMLQKGIISKNELARETGLSFPTISRTIDQLVAAGELEQKGSSNSTGGRSAQLYAVNPVFMVSLSLRIEADKLNWFVSDLFGTSLESGLELCPDGIIQTIDTLIMRVQVRYPQLKAIAAGLAATVHRGTVTECFAHEELRGVNLSQHIMDISKLPCAVEGDMHVVSTGYWVNCSHSPKAVACIYLGAGGLGSGIVIEGKAWHGATEFAGELYYLPIEDNPKYVQTHYAGMNVVEHYGKIIRSYAALLNPDRVVLYENEFIAGKADEIRRICARNLPTQAIPQIEISNKFDEDYEKGLHALASGLLES